MNTTSLLSAHLFLPVAQQLLRGTSSYQGQSSIDSAVRSDPAGWMVAQENEVSSHVLNAQLRSISDELAQAQMADSAFEGIREDLARMLEIAQTLDTDETLSDDEIAALTDEFAELASAVDAAVEDTSYNGQALLDGSEGSMVDLTAVTALDLDDYGTYGEAVSAVQDAIDATVTPGLTIQSTLNPLESRAAALGSQIAALEAAAAEDTSANGYDEIADSTRDDLLRLAAASLIVQGLGAGSDSLLSFLRGNSTLEDAQALLNLLGDDEGSS